MNLHEENAKQFLQRIQSDLNKLSSTENTELTREEMQASIMRNLVNAKRRPDFEVNQVYTVTDFHLRDTRRGVQVVLCQDGVEKDYIQLRGRRKARKIGQSRVNENNLIVNFTVQPIFPTYRVRINETIHK